MHALAHEQFERLEAEHWWFRARRVVYGELLRRALGGRRVARALDLGAGFGGFSAELARSATRVVAVETFEPGARRCRERGAQALVADATQLPFEDTSFDLACAFDVIEHVDDDVAALAELRRVLVPGSLAIVSVPAYEWLWSANDRLAGHRRRYTRSRLARTMRAAGLEPTRVTYVNSLLLPAIALATWTRNVAGARASTNLSLRLPAPLENLCFHAFASELAWLDRRDAPFGHSLVALARNVSSSAGAPRPALPGSGDPGKRS